MMKKQVYNNILFNQQLRKMLGENRYFWKRLLMSVVLPMLICVTANENSMLNMQHEEQNQQKTKMLPYHVLPVYGNASLGYYYVTLYVGTPEPQAQTVIVDTGSGILAVPCTECRSCGQKHLNPPYNPSNSTASKQLICRDRHPSCSKKCNGMNQNANCTFSIYYAQGSSLSGVLIEDDIRFQTYAFHQQIRAAIGCTQRQTNLFVTQKANGIFGLAPNRQSNLLQELILKHSQSGQKKQFSLCLAPNGGLMTVGGINTGLHNGKTDPDISIGYKTDQNLYSLVGVQQISLDETLIFTSLTDRFTGYGIFIDSGSTFSYLPTRKYEMLEKKLNETCVNSKKCSVGKGQDSTCYRLNSTDGKSLQDEVDKLFPPLRYKILNKVIEWPATKYMLIRQEQNFEVCLGILGLDRYLLGANWMYNRDIIFDLQDKMVHIYNNVSCEQDTNGMGKYLDYQETVQSSSEIIFGNTTELFSGLKVNTGGPMFILGVIFLSLGCIGFLLMIIGVCDSNKTEQKTIQLSQQEQNHMQFSDRPESISEATEESQQTEKI